MVLSFSSPLRTAGKHFRFPRCATFPWVSRIKRPMTGPVVSRIFFFAFRELADVVISLWIDHFVGSFPSSAHIDRTVDPHCTDALVCTVTYWWLTETVVVPPVESECAATKGGEPGAPVTRGAGTGRVRDGLS